MLGISGMTRMSKVLGRFRMPEISEMCVKMGMKECVV